MLKPFGIFLRLLDSILYIFKAIFVEQKPIIRYLSFENFDFLKKALIFWISVVQYKFGILVYLFSVHYRG